MLDGSVMKMWLNAERSGNMPIADKFIVGGQEIELADSYAREQLNNINSSDIFIDDNVTSADKVWSSEKVSQQLHSIVEQLNGMSVGMDLSNLTLSTEQVANGTKLILSDGTTTKDTVIPSTSVTDEQLTAIIESKIADGSLSAMTIEDGSIANVKLSAISQSRVNLVDTSASTLNKKLNQYNVQGDNTSYDLTDFIEIELNRLYYITGADNYKKLQYCLYDSSRAFISGATLSSTTTDANSNYIFSFTETTTNAKYIRFSYLKTNIDKVMLNTDMLRDYVHYSQGEKILSAEGEELRDLLNENYKITDKNIDSNIIKADMTDFCFSDDLNLVDCNNYMEVQNSVMKYYYSNYFRVYNNETLYAKIPFVEIYLYDKDKNHLSNITGEKNSSGALISKEATITQENVYYARIVYNKDLFDNKEIMLTRYQGEEVNYHEFEKKWFTLKDCYKEYFIKNVLSEPTFATSIQNIMMPYITHTAGKSYIAFGDSLVQYHGGSGIVGNDNKFLTQINKYLGMNIQNKGYAGSSWTGSGAGDCKARIENLVAEGITPDVITLAWGTNSDAELGTIEDTPSETGSMCAVMKWAVNQIRTNFPNTGIGIIIPPPSISGGNQAKIDLMIACCRHSSMHVPYLDLFHEANMTTLIKWGGVGDDQVHLSVYGINRYASALKGFVESICPVDIATSSQQ